MTEFWALLALITFTATTTGLVVAGVAHLAVATDPQRSRSVAPRASAERRTP